MTNSEILHIWVAIAQGRDNRGDFLNAFAWAICWADPETFAILRPAATALIEKFGLGMYLDNYLGGGSAS